MYTQPTTVPDQKYNESRSNRVRSEFQKDVVRLLECRGWVEKNYSLVKIL